MSNVMNPRVDYEMSQEELTTILDACKPVPCMMIGDSIPSSPQENANHAWEALGKKMGFDSTTARPSNKGNRYFSAVPSETKAQKAERLQRDEISTLNSDVADLARSIREVGSVCDGILDRLQACEKNIQQSTTSN